MRHPRWQEQGQGQEPDYRFSLANERTFLGWLRTALSLLGGAIALVQFEPGFTVAGSGVAFGALLAAAGTGLPMFAYLRWARFQRAMRYNRPLPAGPALLVVGCGACLVGVMVVLLILIDHR